MKIWFIMAATRSGDIGFQGKLPWDRLEGDLPFFKAQTLNQVVLYGRRTYESMGQPLPDRINLVITSSPLAGVEGHDNVYTFTDIDTAIRFAQRRFSDTCDRLYMIGGSGILESAIRRYAEGGYITHVESTYPTDVSVDLTLLATHGWRPTEWVHKPYWTVCPQTHTTKLSHLIQSYSRDPS